MNLIRSYPKTSACVGVASYAMLHQKNLKTFFKNRPILHNNYILHPAYDSLERLLMHIKNISINADGNGTHCNIHVSKTLNITDSEAYDFSLRLLNETMRRRTARYEYVANRKPLQFLTLVGLNEKKCDREQTIWRHGLCIKNDLFGWKFLPLRLVHSTLSEIQDKNHTATFEAPAGYHNPSLLTFHLSRTGSKVLLEVTCKSSKKREKQVEEKIVAFLSQLNENLVASFQIYKSRRQLIDV